MNKDRQHYSTGAGSYFSHHNEKTYPSNHCYRGTRDMNVYDSWLMLVG